MCSICCFLHAIFHLIVYFYFLGMGVGGGVVGGTRALNPRSSTFTRVAMTINSFVFKSKTRNNDWKFTFPTKFPVTHTE